MVHEPFFEGTNVVDWKSDDLNETEVFTFNKLNWPKINYPSLPPKDSRYWHVGHVYLPEEILKMEWSRVTESLTIKKWQHPQRNCPKCSLHVPLETYSLSVDGNLGERSTAKLGVIGIFVLRSSANIVAGIWQEKKGCLGNWGNR